MNILYNEDLIWGFYEEKYPIYTQGPAGAHELAYVIQAGEVNGLVDRIKASDELLDEVAKQFRYYEANHRAKNTEDSLAKAEVNRALAERIEKFLEDLGK